MKNITEFLSKGATVFFPKGVDNSSISLSNVGKLAMALSLAGTVSLATPSQAEARGGRAVMGLIGGMVIGSMLMNRGAVAQPVYPQQGYYPQQTYRPAYVPQPAPVAPYGYGYDNNRNRPGTYYCPQGPQHRCFWKHGSLEINDGGKTADLEVEAPAFRMG